MLETDHRGSKGNRHAVVEISGPECAVELQIGRTDRILTPPKAVAIVGVSLMSACVPKSTLDGFL